jgi:hypothetical protein
VGRLYTLGLLYRITGQAQWAARGEREMLAVAQFTTWNPGGVECSVVTRGLCELLFVSRRILWRGPGWAASLPGLPGLRGFLTELGEDHRHCNTSN